jgi:hypothetical protein
MKKIFFGEESSKCLSFDGKGMNIGNFPIFKGSNNVTLSFFCLLHSNETTNLLTSHFKTEKSHWRISYEGIYTYF